MKFQSVMEKKFGTIVFTLFFFYISPSFIIYKKTDDTPSPTTPSHPHLPQTNTYTTENEDIFQVLTYTRCKNITAASSLPSSTTTIPHLPPQAPSPPPFTTPTIPPPPYTTITIALPFLPPWAFYHCFDSSLMAYFVEVSSVGKRRPAGDRTQARNRKVSKLCQRVLCCALL